MIVIGFNGSCRHAVLTTVLLCLLPFAAFSACWEIVMPGQTVSATDLWQIRNSISGQAALLGESDDEQQAIDVDTVNSFTIIEHIKSGWLSGNRNAVKIEIQLINDQTIRLVSEMSLYYVIDGKRHTVQLGEVVSANRCTEQSTAAAPLPETVSPNPPAPVLVMKNGDVLYGEVAGDELRWQTSYASVGFKPAEIKAIEVGCEAASTGVLETVAGDQLNGHFIDPGISFHLTTGQIIDLPTDQIKMIDFIGTQAFDQAIIKACNSDY